mgnify:CR=1 FL=1
MRRTIRRLDETPKPLKRQAADPLARRLLWSVHPDASKEVVNMSKKKLVMVGNGMARTRLALSSAGGEIKNVIREHSIRVRDDRSALRS